MIEKTMLSLNMDDLIRSATNPGDGVRIEVGSMVTRESESWVRLHYILEGTGWIGSVLATSRHDIRTTKADWKIGPYKPTV